MIDCLMPEKKDPPPYIPPEERTAVQRASCQIRCKLQDLMDAQNITQTQLSERTGLGSVVIRSYRENTAKRFDLGTLRALVDFFNLTSLDDLFEIIRE